MVVVAQPIENWLVSINMNKKVLKQNILYDSQANSSRFSLEVVSVQVIRLGSQPLFTYINFIAYLSR